MELIKGFNRAQAQWEAQNDQMGCGCDKGFCDCDENDGIDPGFDGILGEG